MRASILWLLPSSLQSGFGYIVALCALFAWLLSAGARLRGRALWACALLIPAALAYVLYWSEFWVTGSDEAGFGAFAPVFIVPWSCAGVGAFALTAWLARKWLSRRRS